MGKRASQAAPCRPDEAAAPSFEELAEQQGVVPVDNFDALLGRPIPGDESAEQFSVMLREWRREGTPNDTSQ